MEVSGNNYRKGILFGILVGIVWGLDGVLMGRVGASPIFTDAAFAASKGVSQLSFEFSPLVFWGVVIVCGVFVFAVDPKTLRKKPSRARV